MIILGIDPGLATVGYGIIQKTPNKCSALDYGVIITPKNESTAVRLAMIDQKITNLINQYKPNVVSIEELFFNTNVTTGIKVAEARGVILLCAIKECGLLYEYTPLQVKMALTGNGRADKNQIQFMVRAILGLDRIPKPDDAADALAVAITHANTTKYEQRQAK